MTFKCIEVNLSRGNFSRYVALIKSIFHRSSGVFFSYVRNSLHSCIYLSLSINLFYKIMRPQVCFSTSLFVGGLKIFPKKSLHRENSETNYLYINISLQKVCCLFFKVLWMMNVFSLTIHDSTQPNRKTIITTAVLSFLSVEKIIHHFHLISFTGFICTETNDNNHCKLKKSVGFKASRPFVVFKFCACLHWSVVCTH